jgi:hypothetical protein
MGKKKGKGIDPRARVDRASGNSMILKHPNRHSKMQNQGLRL